MPPGDSYRTKASEIGEQAKSEKNQARRLELEHLARAYVRLAEQAERNARTDVTYESRAKPTA